MLIRHACQADAHELERLAQRDCAQVPQGALLVAEEGGRLLAALSLETGATVADPFEPTAQVVAAMRAYAADPLPSLKGLIWSRLRAGRRLHRTKALGKLGPI
jgi:hypothetical protein